MKTMEVYHYEKMTTGDLPATIEQCNCLGFIYFFGWPIWHVSKYDKTTVAIFKIKPKKK